MKIIIYDHYHRINNLCSLRIKLQWNQRKYCHNSLQQYLSSPFPKVHSPSTIESFWSKWWRNEKIHENKDASKRFTMILPPPNITGNLHIGHALTLSIEDAICRYERMCGKTVLWVPGKDHAGIATHVMVEKKLWAKERVTRQTLGREEFIKRINEWKCQRNDEINEQMLKLGTIMDHSHEYFTLSPQMSAAVTEAFVRLYNNGLIYRDSAMVNWSYVLQSTLSDIEVKHEEMNGATEMTVPGCESKVLFGVMHRFDYPLEANHGNESVTIATTRLETILGDTAIAVNPNDSRFNHLINKRVIHPFTGNYLPIIGDNRVDPNLGSGVLKITPAHNHTDYAICRDHNLPIVNIFDSNGRLHCPQLPQFHGHHRLEAKTLIQNALIDIGLYRGMTDHRHYIPKCSRSGDVIESRIMQQWFLKCRDLSRMAIECVNKDELKLIPNNYRNVWYDFLHHQQDWGVSRQIWWGHRIPAWRLTNDIEPKQWFVAKSESDALALANNEVKGGDGGGGVTIVQDPDVLDTWFSAALLPLSVFGWPHKTQQLSDNFPLSFMETGHDIILFWTARMVMMSLALENKLPFNTVLLHAMVADGNGKKMSKTKGNVIDPLHVINGVTLKDLIQETVEYRKSDVITDEELNIAINTLKKQFPKGISECGADALRMALLQHDFKCHQMNFDVKSVTFAKRFANKMHQTVKFFVSTIDERMNIIDIESIHSNASLIERWIISCLRSVIDQCQRSFTTYDFQNATYGLQYFWVQQLCDVYLECIKPIVYHGTDDERNQSLNVLFRVLCITLRALHPFMPFVTEDLYQRIVYIMRNANLLHNDSGKITSICHEPFPSIDAELFLSLSAHDNAIQSQMKMVLTIISEIRHLKVKNIKKNETCNLIIANDCHDLKRFESIISRLTFTDNIQFINTDRLSNYSDNEIHKIDDKTCLLMNADHFIDNGKSDLNVK